MSLDAHETSQSVEEENLDLSLIRYFSFVSIKPPMMLQYGTLHIYSINISIYI